jgi:archaellum component FlaD/FlaE
VRPRKKVAKAKKTIVESSEEEEEEEERVRPRKKVAKAKKTIVESSEEEEEEVMMVRPRKNAKRFLSSEDEDEDKEDEDKEDEDKEEEDEGEMEEELQDVHGFVVAVYEGQWFPAEICRDQSEVPKGYTKLNYLTIRGSNCFIWGPKPDIMVTLNEDIIMMRLVLEPVNNRGHLALKSSDLKSVLARMVVVYLYKIGVLFHLKFILKAFFHFISKIRYR